jgi:hypothetical protein
MSLNERLFLHNWWAKLPAPGEKALVATLLIAFLILHVVAGTILQRASLEDDASVLGKSLSQSSD